MIITANVSIQISSREYETKSFRIEIPDDIIERYARYNLDLMTQEEAVEYVADNPPDDDREPD